MQVSDLINISKVENSLKRHKLLVISIFSLILALVFFISTSIIQSKLNQNPTTILNQDQAIDYMVKTAPNSYSNRKIATIVLLILFIGSIALVGRKRAIGSILSLILSGIVLVKFMIPLILLGYNPILISIISGAILLVIIMYLSHGINKKSNLALLGTFIGALISVILGVIMINLGELNGFTSEKEIYILMEIGRELQMKYILIASIIIAGIGIIDDLAVNQVSVVLELVKANKNLPTLELFKSAMRVGNDHIASMVNTLIFAYAGSAFTLIMFYTIRADNFSELIEFEPFAEEVFRTLITSIGLILAVPITTIITAWYVKKFK